MLLDLFRAADYYCWPRRPAATKTNAGNPRRALQLKDCGVPGVQKMCAHLVKLPAGPVETRNERRNEKYNARFSIIVIRTKRVVLIVGRDAIAHRNEFPVVVNGTAGHGGRENAVETIRCEDTHTYVQKRNKIPWYKGYGVLQPGGVFYMRRNQSAAQPLNLVPCWYPNLVRTTVPTTAGSSSQD